MSEQQSFLKKSWSHIVTGITCAVVGIGVTLGANVAKVQDTITKAEANKILVASASYSAEYAVNLIKILPTEANKKEAIAQAIQATTQAASEIMKSATATKEIIKDAVDEAKKKDEVKTAEKVSTTVDKKEITPSAETTNELKAETTSTPNKETTKEVKTAETK